MFDNLLGFHHARWLDLDGKNFTKVKSTAIFA